MYRSEMIEYLKEIKRYTDGFPLPFEASEKRVHVCDVSCFK